MQQDIVLDFDQFDKSEKEIEKVIGADMVATDDVSDILDGIDIKDVRVASINDNINKATDIASEHNAQNDMALDINHHIIYDDIM